MQERTLITRIGRSPSPIERGWQLTVENPNLLDELAFNLFEGRSRLSARNAHAAWDVMTDDARERWRAEILAAFHDEISTQEHMPDPDGGGGPGSPAISDELVTAA